MKPRSSWQICLPLVIFCLLYLTGDDVLGWVPWMIALAWMMIGVLLFGSRPVDSFPRMGLGREWQAFPRCHVLRFYHLAWWPWYLRRDLQRLRARRRLRARLLRGQFGDGDPVDADTTARGRDGPRAETQDEPDGDGSR